MTQRVRFPSSPSVARCQAAIAALALALAGIAGCAVGGMRL